MLRRSEEAEAALGQRTRDLERRKAALDESRARSHRSRVGIEEHAFAREIERERVRRRQYQRQLDLVEGLVEDASRRALDSHDPRAAARALQRVRVRPATASGRALSRLDTSSGPAPGRTRDRASLPDLRANQTRGDRGLSSSGSARVGVHDAITSCLSRRHPYCPSTSSANLTVRGRASSPSPSSSSAHLRVARGWSSSGVPPPPPPPPLLLLRPLPSPLR